MAQMAKARRRKALVANLVAPFAVLVASAARAQSAGPAPPDSLVAARALFAEALLDEDGGHFDEALGKFERVRAVRDTSSVEYRIGTCYEGLGQAAPAFRAYLAARTLGHGDPPSADVSRAASDRLDALVKQVARLTVLMPSPAPAHAEVRVDQSLVAPELGAFPVAPGRHVVSATADGAVPFRAETVLAGGDQVSVTVVLAPNAVPTGVPTSDARQSERDHAAVWGWVAIGGGVALTAASAFLLVARHDDIVELNRACPGGLCPPGADGNALESTRSRAVIEGPAAFACGGVGIALAALGVYWVAGRRPSAGAVPAVGVVPVIARQGAGLAFTGALQ
jgi:hypothetical protein